MKEINKFSNGIFTVKEEVVWHSDAWTSQSCNHAMRDIFMVDKSGSITLLLCENYFSKIEDGNYYRLTNMKSIIFNGKGLSTQRFRDVINIDPFDFVVENL